jgi:hypothetical protein
MNRRSRLLIDPSFQKSMLAHFVGLGVGVSAFYYALIQIFFYVLRSKGVSIGLSSEHPFFDFIEEQRRIMAWIFYFATLVLVAGTIAFGLYLSNRIAGPIYRLKKHLQSHKDSNQVPLHFRDQDYFKDLAEEVNAALMRVERQDEK